MKGYVNIDLAGRPDLKMDACDLHRYRDDSIDEIYTSHMIEHLTPGKLVQGLIEWYRVLKVGARLHVRCPNFELYVREWLDGDYDYRWGWGIINVFGHADKGDGMLTRNGFTCKRLERVISRHGFKTIRCEIVETRAKKGEVEYRPNGDLYYEGEKANKPKVLYVDAFSEPTAQANVQGMIKAYEHASIFRGVDYRSIAAGKGSEKMNRILVTRAEEFRPDLVHIGKGESVSAESVERIKKLGCKVIHVYGDYRAVPPGWVEVIGRVADETLLCHQDLETVGRYEKVGCKVGFWMPGTDPEIFCPYDLTKKYQVTFLGSPETKKTGQLGRNGIIKALARKYDVHVFGPGWEKWEQVTTHPFVDMAEFARVCSRSHIVLGINAPICMYTSWRRMFNTMASGAFFLIRYFPGLETMFKQREESVWFETLEECVEEVRYYLGHEEEKEKIARAGRERVLAEHTWSHRAQFMLGKV